MAVPAPPPAAPTGELLAGRYQLERRIGHGGMAEVWVATDIELDRSVAVKLLRSTLATDAVVAERFRREAIAVARLSHPNIVAVHDVVMHEGRQAVVMQLIDGKSLRQLLDSRMRLGPELTIHIGACIAGALDHAHRLGFVHRDVKPGNILVTPDGRVLLTDFGIAKGLDDDDLTSPNVMMGTAKYLSPEQVRAKPLDGRADLYSLGIVLYECLAGRVPFLGESDADTALARLQRDATDLIHLRPTLPVGLVNLIHRTLARNPAHRPQTGALLRTALLEVDPKPPAIDQTPAEPPRSWTTDLPPTRDRFGRRQERPARPAGPRPAGRAPAGRAPLATPRPAGTRRPIPGQPEVSGVVPVVPVAPAATRTRPPTDTTPPARDHTPPGDGSIHGTPARRDEQRRSPATIMIGALLLLAVLTVVALIVANVNDEPTVPPLPTVVPGAAVDVTAPPGPVAIAELRAWDPDGDNGTENDELAVLALADGEPNTAWATECYPNPYMGGKRGVGLIVELTAPGSATLSFEMLSAPYQVQVLRTEEATAPVDLDAWQPVGDKAAAGEPGTIERGIGGSTTHALIWVSELGPDDACSSTNPYRGLVGEVQLVP